MPVATITPIAISALGVVIAVASAMISYRQSRLAVRTRLGQVIDEINKADLEHTKMMDELQDRTSEDLQSLYNARMHIRARKALRLLPRRRSRVASGELQTLANVLDHLGDHQNARDLHLRAIDTAADEGSPCLSRAHIEYGTFLFRVMDPAKGSAELKAAADLLDPDQGERVLLMKFMAIGMRAMCQLRYHHEPEEVGRLLDEARQLRDRAVTKPYIDQMSDDLRDYERQVREASGAPSGTHVRRAPLRRSRRLR